MKTNSTFFNQLPPTTTYAQHVEMDRLMDARTKTVWRSLPTSLSQPRRGRHIVCIARHDNRIALRYGAQLKITLPSAYRTSSHLLVQERSAHKRIHLRSCSVRPRLVTMLAKINLLSMYNLPPPWFTHCFVPALSMRLFTSYTAPHF